MDAVASPPGRTIRRWIELVVLVAVLGAALAAGALWTRERDGGARAPFRVVHRAAAGPAPDVVLPGLDGRPVRLDAFRGQVVVLNFWASWCEPCRTEMPALEAFHREHERRGLVLLLVNYRESAEVAGAFARTARLTAPVLLDGDGAVARRYPMPGLPATFFVDRAGRLVATALGYQAWESSAARAYAAKLLTGD
jgi:thiol-disulfide isomerase/thioredoxin